MNKILVLKMKKRDTDEPQAKPEKDVTHGVKQKVFGARAAAGKKTGFGARSKSPNAKLSITLKLLPETVERWKATGHGWQTRMEQLIRDSVA